MTGPGRRAFHGVLRLTAATTASWAVFAGPAWSFMGTRGLEALTAAAVVCLLSGWLVFALHGLYGATAHPVALVAIGTAVRLAAVFCGAAAVYAARPGLHVPAFAAWLGLFYFATLLLETRSLLAPVAHRGPDAGSVAGLAGR